MSVPPISLSDHRLPIQPRFSSSEYLVKKDGPVLNVLNLISTEHSRAAWCSLVCYFMVQLIQSLNCQLDSNWVSRIATCRHSSAARIVSLWFVFSSFCTQLLQQWLWLDSSVKRNIFPVQYVQWKNSTCVSVSCSLQAVMFFPLIKGLCCMMPLAPP